MAAYRAALEELNLGDVSITEVFDPTFEADENVAMIRIQAQEGQESVAPETIAAVQDALRAVYPAMTFPSVESVGPKVSGELIQTAMIAVAASLAAILVYIWLRFEWQFSVGAVVALVHDIVLTIGLFSLLQKIRFDLATIAALLTIVGYSINDTVVIFDRLREKPDQVQAAPLAGGDEPVCQRDAVSDHDDERNHAAGAAGAAGAGGDVIRGFVFAIFWGVIVGTYSSIFMAKNIVLMIGVKRDWSKPDNKSGTQFSNIDA